MPPLDKIAGTLNQKQAAHLLRRTTFGPTKEDIQTFSGQSIDNALNTLFTKQDIPEPPIQNDGTTWLNPASGGGDQETLIDYFISWHLEQMLKSGTSIKEKIVFFLHSHLPTRRSLIQESEAIYYQNALYRHYAFGSFKELFKRICIDNAMLIYLDGATNINSSPNENFAREMFELYSIGRGEQIAEGNYTNYTEDDIKAATRLLTGWKNDYSYTNLDEESGIPIGQLTTHISGERELANRHDPEVKSFSSAFGNKKIQPSEIIDGYATKEAAMGELDELMDMIFDQDATAQFLIRKIYRHFVYHKISPSVENNVITPLATHFKSSGYDMVTVLKTLLGSVHFFDTDNADVNDDNVGALIKSPIELIFGAIRGFNIEVASIASDPLTVYNREYIPGILECLYRQGLSFYEPYEVAGYPAYHQFPAFTRNWITPHTMAYRYIFADLLVGGVNHDGKDLGFKLDILNWVQDTKHISDPSDAETLVKELIEFIIPFDVPAERSDYFIDIVLLDDLGYRSAWTTEWTTFTSNGSNEASVKKSLENLVVSIMKSPEFQLM